MLACGRLALAPPDGIGATPGGGGSPPALDGSVSIPDGGPCAPPNGPTLISGPVLPFGVAGLPYTTALEAEGAIGGDAFSLVGGTLPSGLSLAPGGVLSGTLGGLPVPDPALFEIQVEDRLSCLSVPIWFELLVETEVAPPCLVSGQGCDAGPGGPLQFLAPTLPATRLGLTYDEALAAVGGSPPYDFALASGTLPPGLFVTLSGLIEGISAGPTGSYVFVIQVTDASGNATFSPPIALAVE